MKHAILFLLLTAALFSACKKDNSSTAQTDYISFKVDGAVQTFKTCQGTYFKPNSINFSSITILGNSDNNNEQIGLNVNNPVVGNPSQSGMTGFFSIVAGTDTTYYNASSATAITINSLTNDRVTGTFQFTGTNYSAQNTDTKNITEGSFGCPVSVSN